MSKTDSMRFAEEYVKKQLASMPKLAGQRTVKLPSATRKSLVRSAALLARDLQRS